MAAADDADRVRPLLRRRVYRMRVYDAPKSHEQLTRERHAPGLTPLEREERMKELSREELASMKFVGAPVLFEHIGPEAPTSTGHPRYPAGRIVLQEQASSGATTVGIRLYDTPEGRMLCSPLEDPGGIR